MNAPLNPPKARAILKAAERLFLQFGFRRTSMDDIARAAGVAKGTLYLYFDSKEAVFRTLQARLHAELLAEAQAKAAGPAPFAGRLFGALYAVNGELFARFGGSDHVLELIEARESLDHHAAEALKTAHLDILAALFTDAAAAGEIDLGPSGLPPAAHAAIATAAAQGAKPKPGSGQDYRRALHDIAAVLAAAVR